MKNCNWRIGFEVQFSYNMSYIIKFVLLNVTCEYSTSPCVSIWPWMFNIMGLQISVDMKLSFIYWVPPEYYKYYMSKKWYYIFPRRINEHAYLTIQDITTTKEAILSKETRNYCINCVWKLQNMQLLSWLNHFVVGRSYNPLTSPLILPIKFG